MRRSVGKPGLCPKGNTQYLIHLTNVNVLKPGVAWQVPKPRLDDTEPLQDPFNIFLDNAEFELSALIMSRPDHERLASQDMTKLLPAERSMARVLGCQDCKVDPRDEEALIADTVPDDRTRDSRTTTLDPAHRSVYVECLK